MDAPNQTPQSNHASQKRQSLSRCEKENDEMNHPNNNRLHSSTLHQVRQQWAPKSSQAPINNRNIDFLLNPLDKTVLMDHKGQPLTVDRILATKPLKMELSTRPGPGNKKLLYLSGDSVTRTLNDIFGFDGWNLDIINVERLDKPNQDASTKRWHVAYQAAVRLTLCQSGSYKEDYGAGDSQDKSLATASAHALKASITDALKRAARHFGDKLGNSLYGSAFSMNAAPSSLQQALDWADAARAKQKFGQVGAGSDSAGAGAVVTTSTTGLGVTAAPLVPAAAATTTAATTSNATTTMVPSASNVMHTGGTSSNSNNNAGQYRSMAAAPVRNNNNTNSATTAPTTHQNHHHSHSHHNGPLAVPSSMPMGTTTATAGQPLPLPPPPPLQQQHQQLQSVQQQQQPVQHHQYHHQYPPLSSTAATVNPPPNSAQGLQNLFFEDSLDFLPPLSQQDYQTHHENQVVLPRPPPTATGGRKSLPAMGTKRPFVETVTPFAASAKKQNVNPYWNGAV
jgi:DNA recombination protein Rad52